MPPRAYVLIFACWALLAVITPTLISWSASAKPNHLVASDPGGALLEIKVSRRMMGSSDAHHFKTPMAKKRDQAPSPAPAPVTIKLKS